VVVTAAILCVLNGPALSSGPRLTSPALAAVQGISDPAPLVEPQICAGCDPPLVYHGGPVMSTHTAAGLTVTPIFWEPGGGRNAFPPRYESIIEGYIANVAAASGGTDNVYSIGTEYYQVDHGAQTYVAYHVHAGATVIDTDAFPASGCRPAPGYTECISDPQLRAELSRVTTNLRLPTDLAHFYAVFFPPRVETIDVDGSNSASGYCGYHRAFGPEGNQTVYANLPYQRSSCNVGEAPNGDVAADGEVSTLSHELAEAITDPLRPERAWYDGAGNEIADMCTETYGRALGSTSASDPAGTEYNQVINGGRYYTQQMFSNLAYTKFGFGQGCTLSQALAEDPDGGSANGGGDLVTSQFLAATPDTLPADGSSTSKIVVTISDASGGGVRGDRVHFAVGVQHGPGLCGTLSHTEETTNDSGDATVTYTASRFTASCWVLATEAADGRAAQAVIYQGSAQLARPTVTASVPVTVQAGVRPVLFTLTSSNPTSHAIEGARLKLAVLAGAASSGNVNASQVRLSYSTTGPKGIFTKMALTGSTRSGNVIEGYLGPKRGKAMASKSSRTITFQVGFASDVPASKTAPLVAFVAYLDQVNPASGSTSTLTESSTTGTFVAVAPASNTIWYVVAAIAVLVLLLAVIAAVSWRRRNKRRRLPPAATTLQG
jgi:Phosphate-induced protein 1 conserved region/Invasin, domain 3